jgi:hypothetical protein
MADTPSHLTRIRKLEGRDMSEATVGTATKPTKDMTEARSIDTTNISSAFWAIGEASTHGTDASNFTFPGTIVNGVSQVSVSICEIGSDGTPFIGAADMSVLNVAPHDDGSIDVRWNVNWPEDLSVRLNFIIVN